MIPEFNDNGNLPPGVYWAEWKEFQERFGYNRRRRLLIDGLEMAMLDLQAAGCRVVYINGSFTTIKSNPVDFDACYDNETVDIDYLRVNAPRLFNCHNRAGQKARYKGEVFPCNQLVGNYGENSFEFFQIDRDKNRKGIIAIDLMRWEP